MLYSEKLQNVWSKDSKRIILSTSAFGKNTYYYPQEVGWFKTEYPYFVERNNLESFLIIVTVKGKGFLEYENKKYTLSPDTITFIDCSKHHKYYASKDEPWEFYWIHFGGSSSDGYYHQFSIANKSPVASSKNIDAAKNAIEKVIESAENSVPLFEVLCSKYITDLLTEALYLTVSYAEQKYIPENLRNIMSKIDKHFNDPKLSLKYFALNLHVNECHLSRQFKSCFGITFKKFLIMKRISKAKELLKYTQLPISDIAEQCGFESSSYFIKTFTKREGLTPLSFRTKLK